MHDDGVLQSASGSGRVLSVISDCDLFDRACAVVCGDPGDSCVCGVTDVELYDGGKADFTNDGVIEAGIDLGDASVAGGSDRHECDRADDRSVCGQSEKNVCDADHQHDTGTGKYGAGSWKYFFWLRGSNTKRNRNSGDDCVIVSGDWTTAKNADIFGVEPNENAEFEAILRQRASMRQGTHAVKNRSAVSGGGKKPWRQKGTGRARQGSIRSPQFRGGGIVFGPTPRSYKYSLPRKVRQLAIKSALSQKVLDNALVVVDALNFDAPKTKEFAGVMDNLKVAEKVLVVVTDDDKNAALSARNLANVTVVTPAGVNILSVVDSQKIVITKSALSQVEEVLA